MTKSKPLVTSESISRKRRKNFSPVPERVTTFSYSAPPDFEEKHLDPLVIALGEKLKAAGFGVSRGGAIRYAIDLLQNRTLWPGDDELKVYRQYGIKDVVPNFDNIDLASHAVRAKELYLQLPDLNVAMSQAPFRHALVHRFRKRMLTRIFVVHPIKSGGGWGVYTENRLALESFFDSLKSQEIEKYLDEREGARPDSIFSTTPDFRFVGIVDTPGYYEKKLLVTEKVAIVAHAALNGTPAIATVYEPAAKPNAAEGILMIDTNTHKEVLTTARSEAADLYSNYLDVCRYAALPQNHRDVFGSAYRGYIKRHKSLSNKQQ